MYHISKGAHIKIKCICETDPTLQEVYQSSVNLFKKEILNGIKFIVPQFKVNGYIIPHQNAICLLRQSFILEP